MSALNFIFIYLYLAVIILGFVHNMSLYFDNLFLEENILTNEEIFKMRVEYLSLQHED